MNQLINYGLNCGLITLNEVEQSKNCLVTALETSDFCFKSDSSINEFQSFIEILVDKAYQKKKFFPNSLDERDAYEAKLFDCIMPSPSITKDTFRRLYDIDSNLATDYLYQLSLQVNYIKSDRLKQNIHWTFQGKYGLVQLTINLAKPEKDPKDIALAKSNPQEHHEHKPLCVLCKENERNYWNARMNLRIVPLILGDETWYFQYSPYLYYYEHAIILHTQHRPMKLNHQTFTYIFDFSDLFPKYFIGSNADIPIVGGSLLNHDHFQAGKHHFPIENAEIIESFINIPELHVSHLHWPLSTIRFTSKYRDILESVGSLFLDEWKMYSNFNLDIVASTNGTIHNTITPILRKRDGMYEMDLILRNNRTSTLYPDGIFHPHSDVQHIKKENIGLIEAMGLAVLPGRLKLESKLVLDYLTHGGAITPELEKHKLWLEELSENLPEKIDEAYIFQEIGRRFERVLEDAGVFKLSKDGNAAIHQFILQTLQKYNCKASII